MTVYAPRVFREGAALTLDSDISEHVQWAIRNIYWKKQPTDELDEEFPDIPSPFHGGQHISRATAFAFAFINLRQRFGDPDALALSPKLVKLIGIAIAFHDSGREGEGEDLWDPDSALNLYYYLTIKLNIDHDTAKLFAEACVNKDIHDGRVYELHYSHALNTVGWIDVPVPADYQKNIFQKIIHDCDCLDIIRAREKFDITYLDIYQDYKHLAGKRGYDSPFNDLQLIVAEAHALIAMQGDEYGNYISEVKEDYELAEDCYRKTLADFQHFPTLNAYTNSGEFLSEAQRAGGMPVMWPEAPLESAAASAAAGAESSDDRFSERSLYFAMRNAEVFFRGIHRPSLPAGTKHDETKAELEFYKAFRRPGTASRTKKLDRFEKQGNRGRSVFAGGWGTPPFAAAGGFILHPDRQKILEVNTVDVDSSFGKKAEYRDHHLLISENHEEKIEADLEHLRAVMQGGGETVVFGNVVAGHNEIMFDLEGFDGLFYTHDLSHMDQCGHFSPPKGAPELQAIYLQQLYQKMSPSEVVLPIFEYSMGRTALHHRIYTDEDILCLWEESFKSLMANRKADCPYLFTCCSLASIKNFMIYGDLSEQPCVDQLYSEELRGRLDSKLKELIDVNMKALVSDVYLEYESLDEQAAYNYEFMTTTSKLAHLRRDFGFMAPFMLFENVGDPSFSDEVFAPFFRGVQDVLNRPHFLKQLRVVYQFLREKAKTDDIFLIRFATVSGFVKEKLNELLMTVRFEIEGMLDESENEFNDELYAFLLEMGDEDCLRQYYNEVLEAVKQLLSKSAQFNPEEPYGSLIKIRDLVRMFSESKFGNLFEKDAFFRTNVKSLIEFFINEKSCDPHYFDFRAVIAAQCYRVLEIDHMIVDQCFKAMLDRVGPVRFQDGLIELLDVVSEDFLTDDHYEKIILNLQFLKGDGHYLSLSHVALSIKSILEQREQRLGKKDLPAELRLAVERKLHEHALQFQASDGNHSVPISKLFEDLSVYERVFENCLPPRSLLSFFLLKIKQMEAIGYQPAYLQRCVDLYNRLNQRCVELAGGVFIPVNLASFNDFSNSDFSGLDFQTYSIAVSHHEGNAQRKIQLDFTGSSFVNSNLASAVLVGVDFSGVQFNYSEMTRADLTDAKFVGADFEGVSLVRAVIKGADFSGTKNLGEATFFSRISSGPQQLRAELQHWEGQLKGHPHEAVLREAVRSDLSRYQKEMGSQPARCAMSLFVSSDGPAQARSQSVSFTDRVRRLFVSSSG